MFFNACVYLHNKVHIGKERWESGGRMGGPTFYQRVLNIYLSVNFACVKSGLLRRESDLIFG